MVKAYSLDLRQRAIRLREKGETQARIGELLDISISTVKRYLVRQKEKGSLAATVQKRAQSQLQSAELAVIKDLLIAKNDSTLGQLVVQFAARTGVTVSVATMGRAIRRLGWTRKKRQWVPPNETNRNDYSLPM